MKQLLLLGIAILAVSGTSAQVKCFERNIGWRRSGLELHTFSDLNHVIHCSVLAGDDSLKVYVFQGDSLQRELQLLRINNEKVRGGFVRDGRIQLLLESKRPAGYHWWLIPEDGSKPQEAFYEFDPHKERTFEEYSAGDRFLVFTIEKKDQSFHIYSFSGPSEPDTMSCVFPDRTWFYLLKHTAPYGNKIDIAKIDFSGNPTPAIASNPNKLYYRSDSVFLIMDADGRTLIYRFDMLHRVFSKMTIRHMEDLPNMKDNSFLLNNNLYYVNATEDSLSVEVNDFQTGKRLRSYVTGKKDTLRFKNTPIVQEGLDMAYGMGSKELDRTRQLMRKMKSGDPFIAAVPQDGQSVALSIGSYKKLQFSNNGGFSGGTKPAITFVNSGFFRSSYVKTAHYCMQMINDGLDFKEGEMKPMINDRIETYTEGLKISETCENLFLNENQYRYAYYDNDSRKLLMIRF